MENLPKSCTLSLTNVIPGVYHDAINCFSMCFSLSLQKFFLSKLNSAGFRAPSNLVRAKMFIWPQHLQNNHLFSLFSGTILLMIVLLSAIVEITITYTAF